MKKLILFGITMGAFFWTSSLFAQTDTDADSLTIQQSVEIEVDNDGDDTDETTHEPTNDSDEIDDPVEGPPPTVVEEWVAEQSVSLCSDNKDNDNDGHIDCDDQDCEIFALCVTSIAPLTNLPEVKNQSPAPAESPLTLRTFSIGLLPGVSTNNFVEGEVVNNLSLNFFGWEDHLDGAEFSILGAVRKGNVRGVQGSHLFNVTAKNHAGLQGSSIVNVVGDNFNGLQGAGIVNVIGEDGKGFQGSGIANVVGGKFSGFQGSGIANVVGGDFVGFQGSGIANVSAGQFSGFQGAGVANVTSGKTSGLQVAGIANISDGELKGLQLGLINVGTEIRGAQIGLINIASKSLTGASIGLINFAGDGIFAPTVWTAPTSMMNVGLKMGSRHFYSLFGGGLHPVGDQKRGSMSIGFGGHVNFGSRLWMEADVVHYRLHNFESSWNNDDIDFLEQVRMNLGCRVGKDISVYAGPALNILVSQERNEVGFGTFYHRNHDDTRVALSPGLTLGIQWEPKIGQLNSQP